MTALPVNIEKCELSHNSLAINSEITISQWTEIGRQLNTMADAVAWWVGDWLLFGEQKWPDRYKQAAEMIGWENYNSFTTAAWVAKTLHASKRVRGLSWSHHREVALIEGEAERDKWLNEAATNNWTVSELRQHIRKHNALYKDDANEPKLGLFTWASSAQELFRHMAAEDRKQPIEQWPMERVHAVWGLIGNVEPYLERVKKRAAEAKQVAS